MQLRHDIIMLPTHLVIAVQTAEASQERNGAILENGRRVANVRKYHTKINKKKYLRAITMSMTLNRTQVAPRQDAQHKWHSKPMIEQTKLRQ